VSVSAQIAQFGAAPVVLASARLPIMTAARRTKCYVSVVVSGSAAWTRTSVIQWPPECQEAVEAAGSQLAERDFRPKVGQVRLAVEPRIVFDGLATNLA
jgi:hypothetical protein